MSDQQIVDFIIEKTGLPEGTTTVEIDPQVQADIIAFLNSLPEDMDVKEFVNAYVAYLGSLSSTPIKQFSTYVTGLSVLFGLTDNLPVSRFLGSITSPINLEAVFLQLNEERETTGSVQLTTVANLFSAILGTSAATLSATDLIVGVSGASLLTLSAPELAAISLVLGLSATVLAVFGIDVPVDDYIFDYLNIKHEFDNGVSLDYTDAADHYILLSRIDSSLVLDLVNANSEIGVRS